MNFKLPSLILYVFVVSACQSNQHDVIVGAWQVDSVSTYYNGFTYQSAARHWNETYEYDSSLVTIRKDQDSRRMSYLISHDTLQYFNDQRIPVSEFRILRLNEQQLVLRKDQAPLWKGPEQTRYEVRYFTRADTTSLVSNRLAP